MCCDGDKESSDGDQGEPAPGTQAKRPLRSRAAKSRDAVKELAFRIWKACDDPGDLRSNLHNAMTAWKAMFIDGK